MRIYEESLGVVTTGYRYWTGFLKSNDEANDPYAMFTSGAAATLNTSCITFKKMGPTGYEFTKESCAEEVGFICQKGATYEYIQ